MRDCAEVSQTETEHDTIRPVEEMSVLVLAHVGDSFYDLYVRARLARECDGMVGKHHRAAIRFACAHGQALGVLAIMDKLSLEEQSIFRRGRNAKSGTVPKNGLVEDYRNATGLETLLGFLYLQGKEARAQEVMAMVFHTVECTE